MLQFVYTLPPAPQVPRKIKLCIGKCASPANGFFGSLDYLKGFYEYALCCSLPSSTYILFPTPKLCAPVCPHMICIRPNYEVITCLALRLGLELQNGLFLKNWSICFSKSLENYEWQKDYIWPIERYFPANIRLYEDGFRLRLQKTSSRRLDQDQYIHLGHMSSGRLQDVFKTSSKRLQDVFKTSSKNVFKKSWRRFQDVFKTSSRRLAKTFLRRLQNVSKTSCKNVFKMFWRRLQDIFKPSCKDVFKTFSRRIIELICSW